MRDDAGAVAGMVRCVRRVCVWTSSNLLWHTCAVCNVFSLLTSHIRYKIRTWGHYLYLVFVANGPEGSAFSIAVRPSEPHIL